MSIFESITASDLAAGLGWLVAIVLAIRPLYERIGSWRLQSRLSHKYLLHAADLQEELEALQEALQRCMAEREEMERITSAAWGAELADMIRQAFDYEELKRFCWIHLEIQFDDLSGRNMRDKCAELVMYFQRRQRLGELIAALRKERPRLDWV